MTISSMIGRGRAERSKVPVSISIMDQGMCVFEHCHPCLSPEQPAFVITVRSFSTDTMRVTKSFVGSSRAEIEYSQIKSDQCELALH